MGGKDRTGWAAASLQLLLGVPADLVMADFMASNEFLRPMFQASSTTSRLAAAIPSSLPSSSGSAPLISKPRWTR